MTKYEKTKSWVKSHQEQIFWVGFGTVVVALVVVAVKADVAYQEQMTSELHNHIDELNALYRSKDLVES